MRFNGVTTYSIFGCDQYVRNFNGRKIIKLNKRIIKK